MRQASHKAVKELIADDAKDSEMTSTVGGGNSAQEIYQKYALNIPNIFEKIEFDKKKKIFDIYQNVLIETK